MSRVYLEATGQYHLALALDDVGLARMVINPKAAKRFAEAMQTRTKTDAVDAAVFWLSSPSACPSRPGPGHPRLRAPHRSAEQAPRTQTKN